MTDIQLFAAAMGVFLLGLVVLGVIADSWDRRDARQRNRSKPWR